MKPKYVKILERDNFTCQECGRHTKHKPHHIFYGIEKSFSERYLDICMVTLCDTCHRKLHQQDYQLALKYKKKAQREFEKKYSHKKFMEECGRNYL
jgi:5-methylcytosine-specific restriction endonuclease McrA